ncbi:penicillin-binding protein 2 [Candidatus Peregrinibacteria bacterium]|jgi:cell division protein FtsI/penicillin-binding protein 2|nr:penicillin-binding protein 2 [Candidatus Peregrinibacteria bacterium]
MLRKNQLNLDLNRIHILIVLFIICFSLVGLKIFWFQIIKHGHYDKIATREHLGYAELPARRGEILITEYHSGEEFKLATNTTLDLAYADPALIKDPFLVAEKLAPLLFNLEEERTIEERKIAKAKREAFARTGAITAESSDVPTEIDPNLPPEEAPKEETAETETSTEEATVTSKEDLKELTEEELAARAEAEAALETERKAAEAAALQAARDAAMEEALRKIKPKTDEELFGQYKHELATKLGEKIRTQILLIQKVDPELKEKILKLNLYGIEITEGGDLYAFPPQIGDKGKAANKLAPLIGFDDEVLERLLLGRNRYTVLKKKLPLETSEAIKELQKEDSENFLGIRLQEEYYRYYPEGQLAAQVLGYVNSANIGQYGIEGGFQKTIEGKKGFFTSQKDGTGNQITVGESVIKPAEDGLNVYLTIDRAIQLEVEKALKTGVEAAEADSGQVIVMDPKTGRILAMAQHPTFNPNVYGEAFSKEEIELSNEQIKNLYVVGTGESQRKYLYIRKDPDERIEVFEDTELPGVYYSYKNRVGPEVYKNKLVQEIYEPGSVFKPLVMSGAIDAGEVTPNTTHQCDGPIEVDEFIIRTFNETYHGRESMKNVLRNSCNIGMAFVARKLERKLLYEYVTKFGFGDRTGIELENEEDGRVEYFSEWAESELVTHGFGQGISATPLQVVTGISALANKGVLMKPYLVEKTENPMTGDIKETEPKKIEQVISPDTAKTITSMMVYVVEDGIPTARVDGHFVAGKSGTSQTYKWGKALKGVGTTIASFSGYGPIDDPQFVILVKMDHPKSSPWGAVTAGPVFKEIATFIFTYYNIPPDKAY